MTNKTNVLIVGAGPTGLLMSTLLQRYGINIRIVDKAHKPVTTSNALAMQTRTVELMDDIGLLNQARAQGIEIKHSKVIANGKKIVEIDFSHLPSHFKFILGIAQHHTESILLANLTERNIAVEMQKECTHVEQLDDGVEVELKDQQGNKEKLQCDYLIACDGGKSVVRQSLNIDFAGEELPEHFLMADAHIHADAISAHTLSAFLTPKGAVAIIPYEAKLSRIIVDVSHDELLKNEVNPSIDIIEKITRERLGFPIQFDNVVWTSGFWVHQRLIDNYRHGNIFFAGDAAHIHSPAGGQGMNTGLQDVYNLAWKLALVIQGKVKSQMLDSYNAERRPVAQKVVKGATAMTHMITLQNTWLQKLRNTVIKSLSHIKKFNTKLALTVTELDIHYRDSEICEEKTTSSGLLRAGDRFIDQTYIENNVEQRMYDVIHGKNHVLIIFQQSLEQASFNTNLYKLTEKLSAEYVDLINLVVIMQQQPKEPLAINGKVIVDSINHSLHEFYQVKTPLMLLVRPDKYVGLTADLTHQASLWNYLTRWYVACN
ncbi:MAG: FAD-dependent monooxygenase [Pseudomonadota bacterium]